MSPHSTFAERREFLQRSATAGALALVSPAFLPAALNLPAQVRIGLIGCGSVSGIYLPHLAKTPHVQVVSLCDIKPERAEKRGQEFNVSARYPNIEQMLAGEPFDLLVNLTNMQEHGKLNRAALLADRHVWSEKPLANSYAEGKALLELAGKRERRLWGAPAVVNSPQFAEMARILRDGQLGRVAAAHAHYGHTGPLWSAFFYEELGGSLPDLGVYNLATLTGLLGPAKSVMAMTSIITAQRTVDDKGTIDVQAEDNAMVLMEHNNGTLSHVQCGFNYFDPFGHEGEGQERPTISVWGSHGAMHLIGYDWAPQAVELSTIAHPVPKRLVTDAQSYVWEQGAAVVSRSLLSNEEPTISVQHALHVLEVIEAARQSQKTGQRVALESTFTWPMV
ncbi:MAG: Gfo/Idh/MocA family oxidoreductase [Pirellulaceae bacterium]|nr:Gfo/Idh/MocA family oxidoreductase [Pirellulaceae bacterium]